jgi:hypothetical protein
VVAGWDVIRDNTDVYYDKNKNTVLMYNVPTSEHILQMSEPTNKNEKSKPFLQRIQLIATTGTIVRATGQIDDGAMKNCISLKRWERYGHCLNPLVKSNTTISVTNATEIASYGTWIGTVQVGGTGALSSFENFDCKGAFNVILGKPWLKAVRARHDYVTDEITIGREGEQEVIVNSLGTNQDETKVLQTTPTSPSYITPVVLLSETKKRPHRSPLLFTICRGTRTCDRYHIRTGQTQRHNDNSPTGDAQTSTKPWQGCVNNP